MPFEYATDDEIEKFERHIQAIIILNNWSNIHQDDPYSIWNVPLDQLMIWFETTEEMQKRKIPT
ncbi:hypothetical protein GHA01_24260 [Novacetimonas hansenii]|uniref:Uncharacterized protein n=1 Tax=Novacetimonas hansenii TaxID=436 RepID=A0ABQ0SJJ5_NOVHA|nr:hypothetical protein Gaha_0122_052 [Novacetimonas hansenii JCM 7643]GBQ55885.1 hypothetical protein AA0243_1040 [Novacetimonas hansenii NRIC 0243]GEC64577.1 hypothetical protein GHA01_24260 [Novacetimonas hansenii]